jgi:hypothetical protein
MRDHLATAVTVGRSADGGILFTYSIGAMAPETKNAVHHAGQFIWLTGRAVEQRRFDLLFGPGAGQPEAQDGVLAALSAYRRPDGGYGYGLDPDGRGPVSQPGHVLFALQVLDEAGLLTAGSTESVCGYLASVAAPDGGIPTVLPSIGDYPRAPWWEVPGELSGSLIPTAAIVGLLHKSGARHPWLAEATSFCWDRIDTMTQTHPYEAEYCITFLDHVPGRDRALRAADRLGEFVRGQGIVALDALHLDEHSLAPGYAPGEFHFPYDFAPAPGSLARRWFSDAEMDGCLSALQLAQHDDGGWPIRWLAWSPVSTTEWRPCATISALKTLRAYGRIR